MKRIGLSLLLLLLVVALAGCRSNVTNVGGAIDDWRNQNNSEARESDIVEYDNGDFGDTLGFNVTYPSTASLVPNKFYTIDQWFGQIQYNAPDAKSYVLRVARSESTDLTTAYFEKHPTASTQTIDGIEVSTGKAEKGCTMSWWTRGDFQYTLHSNDIQEPPTEDELETFVAGLDCTDMASTSSSAG